MSAKTTMSDPNHLASQKLKSGESLTAYKKLDGGQTHRYDVISNSRLIARVYVSDGVATRHSI